MADPFATPADVAARWRELTSEETTRAAVLLGDASRMIRRRFPSVDARIGSGALDAEDLTMIAASMVKRAMLGPGADGVSEATETAGPFARSQKYTNPLGNLYLSADELLMLDPGTGAVAGRRAFSIDLTPGS